MIFQEACDILEISEPFTFKELKKSYYKQSLKYHPDKNRDNKKDCEIKENQWPEKFGFEPPKIKRYTPSTGEWFPEHVDVLDHRTARRFLVAFLYLDHNKRGSTVLNPKGETFVSSCKTGSVLLFPPMWPWLHTGCFPVDKPKYIVGSYLHYS